jgi:DNA-binding Lrp family transcriptional regulator
MKMADAAIDQAEAVNSNNRVTKVMVLEALQALLQESPGGDGPGYVDVGKRAGLSASTARKWIRRLARDGKLPARYVVPSLHAKKKGLHGDTAQERMAVEANIAEIRQTKEDRAAPAWEVPEVRVSARLRSLL